jgi:D-amino-acid oxidase
MELRVFGRSHELTVPDWAPRLGVRMLSAGDMRPGFRSGYAINVPRIDTTTYVPYLRQRFATAGGTTHAGTAIARLRDIPAEYPYIINCAGVGARELANDTAVEPRRGQVALVAALPLDHAIVCDDPPLMYAIPRARDCVWGGTNTVSHDLAPSAADREAITTECARVLELGTSPTLLGDRVGLRPFRHGGVRLQREQLSDGRTVVHNYGHGGAGFTLSWGCAADVLTLLSAP